ncbi:LPXTG cell wall anchor domain-containing protein [Staphylococcus sp. ACRSN]|uniref:LPXTG cell wall anchor domain-containing protein n=1 Tax=Staphylococcus sp. ACRSN TaxID=2918214 RepID=UPI001EF337FB|nr:LPXTG cell wall anchor domain-containing protein [Staphylococcus sp. ACRSN]MCG7339178.1 LPXTG cell wall anchor domain-containing protein [Staphylococcus sp. ACRSN]
MKSIVVVTVDANGNISNEVKVDIKQTHQNTHSGENKSNANDNEKEISNQDSVSHNQALGNLQSDIDEDWNVQHGTDKLMNANRDNKKDDSNHEQGELPSTGQNDVVNTTAYGSLMALIGSTLLFTRRRKTMTKISKIIK